MKSDSPDLEPWPAACGLRQIVSGTEFCPVSFFSLCLLLITVYSFSVGLTLFPDCASPVHIPHCALTSSQHRAHHLIRSSLVLQGDEWAGQKTLRFHPNITTASVMAIKKALHDLASLTCSDPSPLPSALTLAVLS